MDTSLVIPVERWNWKESSIQENVTDYIRIDAETVEGIIKFRKQKKKQMVTELVYL